MRNFSVSFLFVAALLSVVLAIGCGGGGGGGGGESPVGPAPSDGLRADLAGTVTYLGKPVPQATVYLLKETVKPEILSVRAAVLGKPNADTSALTADGNGFQTSTNVQGQYMFSQVPVGTYTLIAMTDPTHQISQSVIVGAISSIDLALKPTGSISGKVLQKGGNNSTNPYVGLLVYLQGTSYVGVTGLDGSFAILNVPVSPSAYVVQPAFMNSYAFEKGPITVTPAPGVDTSVGTLVLIEAVGGIKGIAKLGTDPANISVTVYQTAAYGYYEGYGYGVAASSTDSLGGFEIGNVPFGQVRITYVKTSGGQEYFAEQFVTINSIATQTVPTVSLQLKSLLTAQLEVALSGLTGNGVSFELWKQGDSIYTRSVWVPGNATYSFSNMATGTWGVRVGAGSNYVLLNPAAGSTDQIASITVPAGGTASFAVKLQTSTTNLEVGLSGLISGGAYVRFELWRQGSAVPFASGNSNTAASFTYSNMASGTWGVRVSPGADYILLNPAAGNTDQIASMTVPAGGNASFVVQLQYNKSNLNGAISGIDPSFTTGFSVGLYNSSGFYGSSPVDSAYAYSFWGVPTGNYSMVFQGTGYQTSSSAIVLGAGANTQNITASPTFPTLSAVSVAANSVTVTGTRFDVSASTLEIQPFGSTEIFNRTPTTRTATTMIYDASADPSVGIPGLYNVQAKGADGATTLNSGSYKIDFAAGPTINTVATVIGTTSAKIAWNAVTGAASYALTLNGNLQAETAFTNFKFTGLTPNTTYTLGVKALKSGIAPSVISTTVVTTKNIFGAPITYDTNVPLPNSKFSRTKNGILYTVGDDGSNNFLVRFDLANPTGTASTTVVNLTANLSMGSTDEVQDLSVGSAVFVAVFRGGNLEVYRYDPTTLSKQADFFTVNTGVAGFAPGEIRVLENVGQTDVKALYWGDVGTAGLMIASVAHLVPSNISAQPGAPTDFPFTVSNTITGLEVVNVDSNYIGAIVDGSTEEYLTTDSGFGSKVEYFQESDRKVFDLAPSTAGGVAYVVSNAIRFRIPKQSFGNSMNLDAVRQVAVDSLGNFYGLVTGSSATLVKFNSKGALIDTIDFPTSYPWSKIGNKVMNYDQTTDQIVVCGPDFNNSHLSVSVFSTAP